MKIETTIIIIEFFWCLIVSILIAVPITTTLHMIPGYQIMFGAGIMMAIQKICVTKND